MAGENEMRAGPLTPSGDAALNGDKTLRQDVEQMDRSAELSRWVDEPPVAVPGYACSRCLGEGAYGSVWLAEERNTGKQVAVKFYTHRRGLDWSLLSREVEKLAVLSTSRNIVRLIDVGWDSDPPYYVMEYLENGSLASFLADGPLPPHEAVHLAKSVLQALVHAHGCGILHCDLKPANVLLDPDFEPRICDFGQSRLSDDQNPSLGTLFYMAPEQADLQAVPDARWDVYALGALLYYMLCGEAPHQTEENEQLIRSAESLKERLAVYRRVLRQSPRPSRHRKMLGVDKRLADIVDGCLHVDPQKRYPNAQAVLDMLVIRDRQRARRPLVVLGIIGPGLLLLAMVPIVYRLLQNAVEQARQNLTERALESDVLSAGILSRSLERELEDRQAALEIIAADSPLRSAIEASSNAAWAQRSELVEILQRSKEAIDRRNRERNRELDTSWFLTDARGFQRWRAPPSPDILDDNFAYRDYFHGQNSEYPKDAVPENIKPIGKPHISLAFRSVVTGQYMVAISVPVWDAQHETVIGVLARTTHLGQLLSEYGHRIRGEDGDDVSRVIALADNRGWRLLDHPWMTQENVQTLPSETFELLRLQGAIVEKLERLQANGRKPGSAERVDRDDDYNDPLGQIDADSYGGKWLAAFSPVGGTGWTAIVQERRPEALKPIEEMRSGINRYGLWALVVSCALIGLLWYCVLRALHDRTLRIGLPKRGTLRTSGGSSPMDDT